MRNNNVTNFHERYNDFRHLCFGIVLASICSFISASAIAQEVTRILPLGDSITQGGNERPSYRRTLWLKLKEHGFNVDFVGSQNNFHNAKPPDALLDFDLDHEGHWGWETNEIVDALPAWLESYTADIALVHLGTNDFDRGEPIPQTLEDMSSVLTLLRKSNPEITILLAKIVPMRFKSTRKFNAALSKWASTQSTPNSKLILVDQHAGYYPLFYNYDKYHPNVRGEKKMANRWFDALSLILEPKPDTTR